MSISGRLLRWYRREGRDLPWRETTDPYRILVSEVMLQQTQVSRVLEYFDLWLEQFPDWQALAQASNAEVIQAWAGLGYNRRALMLRDIARHVAKHGLPETREEWMELKGIGPYTSAALAIFSLRVRTLPVDTNIRRVLGRVYLGEPYPTPGDDEDILSAATDDLMRSTKFFDVPQALFDLANSHCTKTPDCAGCPLRKVCKAAPKFLSGDIEAPKRTVKKSKERKHRNKKHPDRIYRGRILKDVQESREVRVDALGSKIDKTFDKEKDQKWLERMVGRMEKDGLVEVGEDVIRLPE